VDNGGGGPGSVQIKDDESKKGHFVRGNEMGGQNGTEAAGGLGAAWKHRVKVPHVGKTKSEQSCPGGLYRGRGEGGHSHQECRERRKLTGKSTDARSEQRE